jgi:hypothetical protein
MRARRPAQFVGTALLAAATLATVVGCGDKGGTPASDGGTCPKDLPATCPSPTPSYAAQVGGIIQSYCVPCHSPTGIESGLPFATYSDIHDNAGRSMDMLFQLNACKMPPPGNAKPPEADRVTLLGWLVCEASGTAAP